MHAAADPAKDDPSQLNVQHRNKTADRSEGIVHRIHSAAGSVRGDRGKERRVGDTETYFLALHIAVRRVNPKRSHLWITRSFAAPANEEPHHKHERHRHPDRPPMFLALYHSAQVVSKGTRNREDR